MTEARHAGEDSPLPDDSELAVRRARDAHPGGGSARAPAALTDRAAHTPPEIFGLLDQLGIGRDDPWVWMTTAGRVSPERPRFRVNDGGPRRYVPLHPEDAKAFDGYSLVLLGIRLRDGDPYRGLLQFWEDQPVDVRYMRVRWQGSALYAEYTTVGRKRDAAIRGAHLKHKPEDRKRAWHALDLIFKGLRGAPEGPRRGGDIERWVERAEKVGEKQAQAEHKAELGPMYTAADNRWWDRSVRHHLKKRR